jgi:hypothetical protein
MTVSDAESCGITYNHYSDASRGVIYNCIIFHGKNEQSKCGEAKGIKKGIKIFRQSICGWEAVCLSLSLSLRKIQ